MFQRKPCAGISENSVSSLITVIGGRARLQRHEYRFEQRELLPPRNGRSPRQSPITRTLHRLYHHRYNRRSRCQGIINRRDLRIITNSLLCTQILYKNQDIEVMVPEALYALITAGLQWPVSRILLKASAQII